MKFGVCTSPWGVDMIPLRARPSAAVLFHVTALMVR
jgi:hypothetical protein